MENIVMRGPRTCHGEFAENSFWLSCLVLHHTWSLSGTLEFGVSHLSGALQAELSEILYEHSFTITLFLIGHNPVDTCLRFSLLST